MGRNPKAGAMHGIAAVGPARPVAQDADASCVATPVSRRKGLVKVMYRMHPRHVAALRTEAFRRAERRAMGRPDASEVLREIVEAWLEARDG
jgi:hypothetical protein